MDEEKKKRILEIREGHRKLSEIILAGTEYSETVEVVALDGEKYEVRVYALSDEQYRSAVEKAGLSSKQMMDKEEILGHWKLAQTIAPIATRDPGICSALKPAQTFRILEKVLKISDFPFRGPAIPSEKPVQPAA